MLSSDFINTLLGSLGSDPEHPTPQDFVPSRQSSAAGFLDSPTHHLTGFPNFTVQARAVPPWPSRCWRSLFKDRLGNIQEDKVINAALSISIPQLWCPRSSNLAPHICFPSVCCSNQETFFSRRFHSSHTCPAPYPDPWAHTCRNPSFLSICACSVVSDSLWPHGL